MFIVQTIKGHPLFDFQYELINASLANEWLYPLQRSKIVYVESIEQFFDEYEATDSQTIIPVGSLDFVNSYIEAIYKKGLIKAPHMINRINIPDTLAACPRFVKRTVANHIFSDELEEIVKSSTSQFIVKGTEPKQLFETVDRDSIDDFLSRQRKEKGNDLSEKYFVNEKLAPFISEWRGFVHRGGLLDIRRYSGDFYTYPEKGFAERIISTWEDAPPAYVIDLGVTQDKETVLIECANFISCGLYGFSDDRLPAMTREAFIWEITPAANAREEKQ